MNSSRYSDAQPGDALPALAAGPITRHMLALYCGASGDHNPIHVDQDFARAAGMPDVFAHGMLSTAYLARLLTGWAPQSALREFAVRFVAVTHVGDDVRCTGQVVERYQAQGETRLRIELQARSQAGELRLSGIAVMAVAGATA